MSTLDQATYLFLVARFGHWECVILNDIYPRIKSQGGGVLSPTASADRQQFGAGLPVIGRHGHFFIGGVVELLCTAQLTLSASAETLSGYQKHKVFLQFSS